MTIRRREEGIPPRNFKKPRRKEMVPVEPVSILLEVLLESHTKAEISARSGVDDRQLSRLEKREASMVGLDQVDRILLAFDREEDMEGLYPLDPEPEKLVGYHVLDPHGVLNGKRDR